MQKVPGRMGMIVTLYLISANVYNSVEAPKDRGFSYIELWMVGTQFPILLALCEYGIVLYLQKVEQTSMMKFNSLRCCRRGSFPSTAPSMKLNRSNGSWPPELNANQMLNLDETKPDLDVRIKRLDFATMLFSLIYFITFVLLYLTVL